MTAWQRSGRQHAAPCLKERENKRERERGETLLASHPYGRPFKTCEDVKKSKKMISRSCNIKRNFWIRTNIYRHLNLSKRRINSLWSSDQEYFLKKKRVLFLTTSRRCLQAEIPLCPCGGGQLHLFFLPESNACLTLGLRGIHVKIRGTETEKILIL